MNLEGKNVLVVGLGISGAAAARLLLKKKAHVFITDQKSRKELGEHLRKIPSRAHIETGSHTLLKKKFDLIVVSPGVPWRSPFLEKARGRGIPVWPELELAWRMVKPRRTVAITGTNGKTTTTALIGEILKKAGRLVVVGGNIGTPLSALVSKVTAKTDLVLEVSSYQLEGHQSFHPEVGAVLNVTPDHLARHRTMAGYAAAKRRLFLHATRSDVAILNRNDKWCRWIGRKSKARKIWFPTPSLLRVAASIRLPGRHNLENAMAAVAAVKALGLKESDIKKGLASFKGVKHRIQFIAKKKGVSYYNDSKGTNVDSTLVALKALPKPILLILGGEHKGSPYTPLIPLIKEKVRVLLTIGEAAPIIARDLRNAVPLISCRTLDRAVKTAGSGAQAGDVVLLSPACASFDQYRNYEERGDHFISLVRRLKI
ncbi:MAG: UDP-N-acetylmuramoyl-L-alanine--D-glutamate ligase [Elusimicrobia bacterium]|nr:UDP-N-acetylmuramoyl-L-alanine--D-glutamate ligase [Candidatus Obscuribacterium magneticum]